jgi:hypothetical protein
MTFLPAVNFAYGKMYDFYRNFGEATDDVFVRIYNADHAAKFRPGQLRPFTERSMQVRKVLTDDSLSDEEYGTFLAHGDCADDQSLIVVRPSERLNELYSTFWSGDHFTFQCNSGLQLIDTHYASARDDCDHGLSYSFLNPLPLEFVLPTVGFERMIDPMLKTAAPFLHDLMRRPFVEHRSLTPVRPGSLLPPQTDIVASDSFESLWHSLPIRSMTVVGVRVGQTYDVSAYIRDNYYNVRNRVLLLKCLERDVEGEIAKGLEGYDRDNFGLYDPPDDISDM